jgi:hypothetical protein
MQTMAMCAVLLWTGFLQGGAVATQSIGSVYGMDSITQIHITNLLQRQGISCMMAGSKTYGIMVPSGKAAQATALLKKDAPLRGYAILFTDGTQLKPPATKAYRINKPYVQVIKSPNPAFPALLLSVLREKSIQVSARRLPVVVKFDVRQRDYMLPNGQIETGYEGDLELGTSDHVAGKQQHFEVWELGKRIYLQGSSEWKKKR